VTIAVVDGLFYRLGCAPNFSFKKEMAHEQNAWRRTMTTNFVNPELRVTANPIPPSDQEQAAVKELESRFAHEYSSDQIAARVVSIEREAAERRAMHDQPQIKTFSNGVIERLVRKAKESA
jgi:hypothetical protein